MQLQGDLLTDPTAYIESLPDYTAAFPFDSLDLSEDSWLNLDFPATGVPFGLENVPSEASQPGHFSPGVDLFDHVVLEPLSEPWNESSGSTHRGSEYEDSVTLTAAPNPSTRQSSGASCHLLPCDTSFRDKASRDHPQGNKGLPPKNISWEGSIVVFPTQSYVKLAVRKRRRYATSRRQKVAMNRWVGACTSCRLRKAAVRVTRAFDNENTDLSNVPLGFPAKSVSYGPEASLLVKRFAHDKVSSMRDSITLASQIVRFNPPSSLIQ